MTTTTETDKIIAGDTAAFGEFISNNRRKMYAIIFNMVRNHQDAEDLLQDSIIKAYKNVGSFQKKSQLQTWLNTIAINTTINFLKKRNRFIKCNLDDTEDPIHTDTEFLEVTKCDDASKETIRKETYSQLHSAIEKLNPSHRQIVKWIHMDGLNHGQISERLNIPVGTVRSRLFYAHKQLKKMMVNTHYA